MSTKDNVPFWSKAVLLRMVQQPDWPSPVLAGKERGTLVRRIMQGKRAQIEKMYQGGLARYQQHENGFIEHLSHIRELHPHLAHWSATTRSATMQQRCLYTEWSGLDVMQWQTLLGAHNPLTNSVPGVLYLVRCILQACHLFHQMGYVHNDLHLGNLSLGYRYDWYRNSVILLPQQMRLIDFEFACYPRADHPRALQESFPPRPPGWVDANGMPYQIDPNLHSAHVCPYEVEPARTDDEAKRAYLRYRTTADGNMVARAVKLENIDFGVDFFTLGQSLDGLLARVENDWDDKETLRWPEANTFLWCLPQVLRDWDASLPAEIRPAPHLDLIAQIDAHLGNWASRCNWQIALPGMRRLGRRAGWGAGAAGLVAAGLGVAALFYPPEEKPPPPPPYEVAVLLDSVGKPLQFAADDRLSLIVNNRPYKSVIGADGRFYFQLPPEARGQKAEVKFQTNQKYEATKQHLVLSGAALRLPIRGPTQRVMVTVKNNGTKVVANAKVWVSDKNFPGGIWAEPDSAGVYILHLPEDVMDGKIEVCAPGFMGASLNFNLRTGPTAYTPEFDLKAADPPFPACPPK